jgi:hypothetical protein
MSVISITHTRTIHSAMYIYYLYIHLLSLYVPMQYLPQRVLGTKYTMLNIPQFIASTSQLSMHTPAPSTMQAVIVEFVPNTVWYDPIGKHTCIIHYKIKWNTVCSRWGNCGLFCVFLKVRKNNPAVKSFLNCVFNWKRYRFHKSNP